MPRRFRLRDAKAVVDVADAHFAGEQQAENPQPGRIRERFEERFKLAEGLFHIFVLTNISRSS